LSGLQAISSDTGPQTPTCCYGINADVRLRNCVTQVFTWYGE